MEIACLMESLSSLRSPSSPPFAFQASAPCPGKCKFNDGMKPWKEAGLSSSKLSLSKRSLCREHAHAAHTHVRNYPAAGAKKDCSRGVERNCPSFLEPWSFPSCTHTQRSNSLFPVKGLARGRGRGSWGCFSCPFSPRVTQPHCGEREMGW